MYYQEKHTNKQNSFIARTGISPGCRFERISVIVSI